MYIIKYVCVSLCLCVCVCASIFSTVSLRCATVCIDTCALTEANQLERGTKAKQTSAVSSLELSLSRSVLLGSLRIRSVGELKAQH